MRRDRDGAGEALGRRLVVAAYPQIGVVAVGGIDKQTDRSRHVTDCQPFDHQAWRAGAVDEHAYLARLDFDPCMKPVVGVGHIRHPRLKLSRLALAQDLPGICRPGDVLHRAVAEGRIDIEVERSKINRLELPGIGDVKAFLTAVGSTGKSQPARQSHGYSDTPWPVVRAKWGVVR